MKIAIDHTELQVPDREAAAVWYREWLGFEIMPEFAAWAASGPLMLTADNGTTMLALFPGDPQGDAPHLGWRRVSWRVEGGELVEFTRRYRASGQTIEGPVDHEKAWSVYFNDPWGNPLELTTYDYAEVATAIG
jgi:catechol 2,3-dioxygenase-like lactoylglutathione lyase family enzyme